MTREEAREAIKEAVGSSGLMLIDEFVKRKVNGTLDKVRAEILDNAFSVVNPHNTYKYINVIDLDSIDEILDKYKGESEPQESDIEKFKPCINYEDGCEEWAGCPCVYYKGRK